MRILVIAIVVLGVAAAWLIGQKPVDTPNLPPIPMQATIESGYLLRSDGLGGYVHDVDSAQVRSNQAFSIMVWKFVNTLNNDPGPSGKAERIRSLGFDLSQPVASSGAKPLGLVADNLGRFHAFWKHDHSDDLNVREFVHRFEEVGPPGKAERSSRVEMWVRVDGRQHVLQMGPWGMGEFTPRAKLHGEGTTEPVITRTTENAWTINAPKGSIARLWDYHDIMKPIDKGLYYFDFKVIATKL